jgi:hypothetical protein
LTPYSDTVGDGSAGHWIGTYGLSENLGVIKVQPIKMERRENDKFLQVLARIGG